MTLLLINEHKINYTVGVHMCTPVPVPHREPEGAVPVTTAQLLYGYLKHRPTAGEEETEIIKPD